MCRGTNYNKKTATTSSSSLPARGTTPSSPWSAMTSIRPGGGPEGYVIKLQSEISQILKNSVTFQETAKERIISDEGPGSGQGSDGPGAEIHEGAISF